MECGNGINFEHWSKVATIEIWEAAAMMTGVDPRALFTGYVVDMNGDIPAHADEERQLTSAVRAGGLLVSDKESRTAPGRNSHLLTTSLIEWFRKNGRADLAHGLEHPRASGVFPPLAEARRRLDRLRSLGGDCTFDKMDGKWKVTGLKDLKIEEVADGMERTSEKTLRGDLILAAEAEQDALRAGQPQATFPGG